MSSRKQTGHRGARTAALTAIAAIFSAGSLGCTRSAPEPVDPEVFEPAPWTKHLDPPPDTPDHLAVDQEPAHVQAALQYYEAVNKARRTGDAEQIREISAQSCAVCHETADRLEQIHQDGRSTERGEATRAPDSDIISDLDGSTAQVSVLYTFDSQAAVTKEGGEQQKQPTNYSEETFTLENDGARWMITDVRSEESDPP